MKYAIPTIIISCIIVLFCLILTKKTIPRDYTCTIIVDDSAKIEQAISNAVCDITTRNFIVTRLAIYPHALSRNYTVECQGTTKGALLALDK